MSNPNKGAAAPNKPTAPSLIVAKVRPNNHYARKVIGPDGKTATRHVANPGDLVEVTAEELRSAAACLVTAEQERAEAEAVAAPTENTTAVREHRQSLKRAQAAALEASRQAYALREVQEQKRREAIAAGLAG